MQGVLPLYERFLSNTSQLRTSLSSTLSILQAFTHTLQQIANTAANTAGIVVAVYMDNQTMCSGRNLDLAEVLTRVCEVQRVLRTHLESMAR